jgi:Trypsin-like peptidase domain
MRRALISTLAIVLVASTGLLLAPITSPHAQADDIKNTIVYIHCTIKAGKAQAYGSGVLVSETGNVLTAGHVVKDFDTDKDKCFGTLGFANADGGDPLILQQTSTKVDAALLRFSKPATYAYVKYCSLEPWMERRDIYSSGYPGDTKTGTPSFRKGVLSSAFADSKGVIETDSLTVAGMSGGPVFTGDLKSFIGIVVGADFDASGAVGYYGILPTEKYAQEFNLLPSGAPCYRKTREIELPSGISSWKPRQPVDSFPLGVRTSDGFCFISGVRGIMRDTGDTVRIAVADDQYFLVNESPSGSEHSADVRCVSYQ